MNGLGDVISLSESMRRASASVLDELKMRSYLAEEDKAVAVNDVMRRHGAGEITLEDAGNALLGVDPDKGLALIKEHRSRIDGDRKTRTDFMGWFSKKAKGVESQEDLDYLITEANIRGKDVPEYSISHIPTDFKDFGEIKSALIGEADEMTGLMKDIRAHESIETKYGPDDERTKSAWAKVTESTDKLDKSERDFRKSLRENFTSESIGRFEESDDWSELERHIEYKDREVHLGEGRYQKQESADGGETWEPVGDPYKKKDRKGASTAITKNQLSAAQRIIDADEELTGISNDEEMRDAAVTRANNRARDNDDDYVTILRKVFKGIKKGEIKKGAEGWFWDDPSTFEHRAVYETDADVIAAAKAGDIEVDQAKQILKEQFGYND